jgi:undecaprenyl-diphosphatase
MEMTWLESIVFGMISGFTEFLPLSSLAHQTIYLKLIGEGFEPAWRLFGHIGSFSALLTVLLPALLRMRRERLIAAMGRKRRRQPDEGTLAEYRVLRVATTVMLVLFVAQIWVGTLYQRMWLLAILVGINGVMLYIPQFLPTANKSAKSLSGLDSLLVGLAGGCGVIPGLSTSAFCLSTAQMLGTERRYTTELVLTLNLGALLAWIVVDAVNVILSGLPQWNLLHGILILLFSFIAAYLGIKLMRFLAVKTGYSGFAYYCWGVALFTLILYLI